MKGVHTALVTPFAADGTVDLDAYTRLAERQIAAGIHGLVACGTTGETPTLERDEWRAIVRTTVSLAGGKIPVTAGVGTNCTRTTLANLEEAAGLGVDAGLMVFPYYNKPNPAGLRAHVAQAAGVGLPLVLYHVPGRTGQRLSPSLLAELADVDGVVAVKEATGDLHFGGDLLRRTQTPVLSGDDFTFLQLLAAGGRGVISVVSNVAPAQTVAVYTHHTAGRVEEAAVGLRALWDLITFLFSDTNPTPCKAVLAELGLCSTAVRLPLAPYEGPSPAPILEALGLTG
ncbi:MAG: 4-hydroxy-tetrahydrodipicolinate synthase [Deltaproteobacteria bacterium]|nr:4-hydroxy-tetrahydrodipicolinate synthase [Deltaproteobacteria bacterium]